MQKRSLAHRASLTRFLLFCNQLPSTEIVDSLLSPDGALSRIIGDNQRYLTQSPTLRESLNLGTEENATAITS
jgi:hypothetical protein